MVAGVQWRRANIWRINNQADNSGGGAVVSGTVVHSDVLIFWQEKPAEQIILQQGLETERIFAATLVPGTLDIRERDEIEITFPFNDYYYGKRFRIIGVQPSSHLPYDPRNYMLVTMVRSVRSHSQQ